MEEKIALISCLIILYIDSLSSEDLKNSEIITETLELVKTPSIVTDSDVHAAISGVKNTVHEIAQGNVEFDLNTVLQKIRVYCTMDRALYDSIKEALESVDADPTTFGKVIGGNIRGLQRFINLSKFRKTVSKISFGLNSGDEFNLNEAVTELEQAASNVRTTGNSAMPSLMARVGTDDEDATGIETIFENTKKQLTGATLKTGWKWINQMLGINDGFARGELVLMPALPHNAKTLFSLSMMVSFALFNNAEDFVKDGNKAMLLDISLENELEVNLPLVYKMVVEHFTGVECNIKDIVPSEAAAYIKEKLRERGWHYVFERHENSKFTHHTLRDVIVQYENMGYEIIALRGDYFGTANMDGLNNGTNGSQFRQFYREVRNIITRHKITTLAPHQLSPKAKELHGIDKLRFVRSLPGRGLYDGCTTIDNEADCELYFGITEVDGISFFEVQRGKHRTLVDTPQAHRYGCMKFSDIGILPWDYDKDYSVGLRSVNTYAMQNEDEVMFRMALSNIDTEHNTRRINTVTLRNRVTANVIPLAQHRTVMNDIMDIIAKAA